MSARPQVQGCACARARRRARGGAAQKPRLLRGDRRACRKHARRYRSAPAVVAGTGVDPGQAVTHERTTSGAGMRVCACRRRRCGGGFSRVGCASAASVFGPSSRRKPGSILTLPTRANGFRLAGMTNREVSVVRDRLRCRSTIAEPPARPRHAAPPRSRHTSVSCADTAGTSRRDSPSSPRSCAPARSH